MEEPNLAVLEDLLDLGVGDETAGLGSLGDLGILVRDRRQILQHAEERGSGHRFFDNELVAGGARVRGARHRTAVVRLLGRRARR